MRDLVNWKDHVVEFPGRYEEKDLGGGLVQHTASPGKVKQQLCQEETISGEKTTHTSMKKAFLVRGKARKRNHIRANQHAALPVLDRLHGIITGCRMELPI